MAVVNGTSIINSGLSFYIDQSNIKSYAGPAIQNLSGNIGFNNSSSTGISITGGYETVTIPQLGTLTATYSVIQNNYTAFTPNSTDCCPSPIGGWGGFAVTPSTLYTYAIVYKVDSGYTNSNYMYRYEYTSNGGSYVGEGGVFNDSNRVSLGDGWFYAWGTFTTAATTNWIGYAASFYYRYSQSTDKLWVAKVLICQGNYSGLHPIYWPDKLSTRSTTAVLYDIAGSASITANSLTYASNGVYSFNGTSNYVTIPNTQLGNGNLPWTVSCWVKTTTAVNGLGLGSVLSNSSGGPVYSVMGVNSGKIVYWTYQNSAWAQKLGVGTTVNDGNWHMLTWVNYSNYTMDMYVDGKIDSNVANSTSGNNNPVDRIGGSWAGFFQGSIAVLSRYSSALTAAEVFQNFTAMRGRFGV